VLEAIVLEGVLMVTLANFAADIFHWRLDPRLRTRTT
jgi:ABC-type dipeptide/oligopeptide/nickel transport system permease component